MLSIDFLRGGKRAGMEFIDFQNDDYRAELVTAITPFVKREGDKILISKNITQVLGPIIEKYNGFKNINFQMMESSNLGINVGYFSPGNILNFRNIEEFINVNESNLAKWYGKERSKVFKGSINYDEGKVYGSYTEIPATLFIGSVLEGLFDMAYIKKTNTPIAEVVAGAIIHEVGHLFFACSSIDVTANDNFVMRGALKAFGATNDKEKRLVIIRSTASLLETNIDRKDDIDGLTETKEPNEILLYFSALIERRNTRRALSLGVDEMTSEVAADLFAIRMGFDRGLVAVVGGMSATRVSAIVTATAIACLGIWLMCIPMIIVGGAVGLTVAIVTSLGMFTLITGIMNNSNTYNSPFRRFEDAVRQSIAKIKEVKNMSSTDRELIVKQTEALLKECEKHKPIISGTVVERFLGGIIQGGEFKANEFEHFTQSIANNEIELLNAKLSTL